MAIQHLLLLAGVCVVAAREGLFVAQLAAPTGDVKGDHHPVPWLDRAHIGPNSLHDSHVLVPHDVSFLHPRHLTQVKVQVAATDGSRRDADDGVLRVGHKGLGGLYYTHIFPASLKVKGEGTVHFGQVYETPFAPNRGRATNIICLTFRTTEGWTYSHFRPVCKRRGFQVPRPAWAEPRQQLCRPWLVKGLGVAWAVYCI